MPESLFLPVAFLWILAVVLAPGLVFWVTPLLIGAFCRDCIVLQKRKGLEEKASHEKAQVRAWAEDDSPRTTALLLEALLWETEAARRKAAAVLASRLNALSAEEYLAFTPYQRHCLRASLTLEQAFEDPAFVLAAIACTERMLDAETLPALDHLATTWNYLPNLDALQRTAAESGARLRLRLAEEHARRTLVRATCAYETETLLRPRTETLPVPDEQLLRPILPNDAEL
jgi:hypothetical protein